MLPITLGDASFKYGPIEIPYASVSGAGVGVRNRRTGFHRVLLIGYQLPGEPKKRLIAFGLEPGAPGEEFAASFRAHVADRWMGEAPYFATRKRLGFSNNLVFAIVGAIVAVTVVAVLGWAMTVKRPDVAPRRPGTSSQAPGR